MADLVMQALPAQDTKNYKKFTVINPEKVGLILGANSVYIAKDLIELSGLGLPDRIIIELKGGE